MLQIKEGAIKHGQSRETKASQDEERCLFDMVKIELVIFNSSNYQ
jgi:hypothetical protein